MSNILNNKYLYSFIFLGLVLHFISSYFSIGFYSDDEHFQILEISAYLLGINTVAIHDLSGYYWEWTNGVRMRPWFQPFIYFKFINFLKIFIEDNPFLWTYIIRLISSALGYFSIIYLFLVFKDIFFKNHKIFNYLLFFTFWFYPFLHSRTSSENLSLSLFLISFCIFFQMLISKKYRFNYFLFSFSSFLMGMSMVAKFTTVFIALPFFFWLLVFKFNFYRITVFGVFILVALSLGLYIDYINWGSFKNTYYQFYYHNLTAGEMGKMKYFGVEPWYYYFIEIIKQLAPILSVFFLIGIIFFWISNYKNVITWMTVFAFVVFSAIGHKEIRYMFPIYIFAPFFIAYLIDKLRYIYIINIAKYLIILSNLIFLFLTLFTPANAKVGVYKFVYDNVKENEKIYFINHNPYLVNNMEAYFYTHFLPEIHNINNIVEKDNDLWITSNNFDEISEYLNRNCEIKYSTYPKNIINLNKNWKRLKLNWYVLYCE